MPKKKKTRQQKMLADQRHNTHTFAAALSSEQQEKVATTSIPLPLTKPTHSIATIDYAYLGIDLRKTIFFTSSIIVIELAIHIFTKGF